MDHWRSQAEMIFKAVSKASENYEEAEKMISVFYVPDKTFARQAINHALNRLREHFG